MVRVLRLLVFGLVLAILLPGAFLVPPAGAAPPPPPTLLQPSDGQTTSAANYPPTGTPTFVWSPVSGADLYKIQICPSAECATPVVSQETYSTRFTPFQALADGIWFWRVQAHNADGWGDFSSPRQFTKSWLADGALAPTLLVPASGETVEFFEYPIFSWSPVVGAAYYRLTIATDSFCNTPLTGYPKNAMKNTYSPMSRIARGQYYWKVTPVDHRGHQGNSSECRPFYMDYLQVPTLLSPDNGSHHTFTPDFRWTAVKGAKDYHFQVSTAPDFSALVLNIYTYNTRYTPPANLDNDREYYWRVAARDTTNTEGPWSEVRSFVMEWHLAPTLLSPGNNYIHAPFPVFQWTPVAGAWRYNIEADTENSFAAPLKFDVALIDPRYDHLNWGTINVGSPYYWRVRAEDRRGNVAWWGQTFSFDFSWTPGPTLIYPFYYYDPATTPSTQYLDIRTDPTVPVPVFMWDRVVHHSGSWETAADTYVIEVDDNPAFSSPDWTATTHNLSIVPTPESPFSPVPGTIYYWRVRAYLGGSPMGDYSEVWPARFDPSLQIPTDTIALYFPQDGTDSVYDAPLFGWSPVQGAARYHFQLSTSPDFASLADEAHPLYPFYTPQNHLAPETYYWRVAAQDAGGGYIGTWSETRRVVITYPLRRGDNTYPLVTPISQDVTALVGQDASGDVSFPYDLTNLYLAQDNNFWYLTILLPPTNTTDMYFVFYVDLDHRVYSGGETDPLGMAVQAEPIYYPERVLYAHHTTAGTLDEVKLYTWQGSSWGPPQDLTSIGGQYAYQRGHYLELRVPLTAFDISENWLGTVSLEVFTAPAGGQAQDTVPPESASPTGNLTNFTAAADKLNPLHPWDNPFSNPFILYQNVPLSFAKPLPRSYVSGYKIQVSRDIGFTDLIVPGTLWTSGTPPQYWFLGTRWTWTETFEENNTLYWRVRICHDNPGNPSCGPWSQPVRFTKKIYTPQNLSLEYPYAAPSFRWDRVEGASYYRLQVSSDRNFATLKINQTPDSPSYTPYIGSEALADRTWYWRVQIYDGSGRASSWSPVQVFTKTSPMTTLISPTMGVWVRGLPTFQWEAILYPSGEPVVSAPRYRLLLDNDPNFSSPIWGQSDTLDTISVTPWRDSLGLADGTYYWKVAMIDAGGNYGPYQEVGGFFYKTYYSPTLLAASFDPSPDLTWAPLDGAAYYKVQICRDPYFSNCVETVSTDATRFVATKSYSPGNYYWRVCMCDQDDNCGPYFQSTIGPYALRFLPLVYKHKRP